MKKNKGFSIPELLAVIVIMGILMLIASASYIGISKRIKLSAYNNKINLIKTKSIEYATDNNVNNETISVAKLVLEGYLEAENDTDENEKISNPLGGYLDCYEINLMRDLDEYNVDVNAGTSCDLANLDIVSSRIKIKAYEFQQIDGQVKLNYNSIGENKNIRWTNKDVYLFLEPNTLPSTTDVKIIWGTNSEAKSGQLTNNVTSNESFANIYKVRTSLIYNNNIRVQIQADGKQYSQIVSVKIDKEAPSLAVDVNASYEASKKKINFNGSDGDGSGFGEYAYALMEDKKATPVFNIKNDNNKGYKDVDSNTVFYAYARDKAGNISKAVEVSVTGIDMNNPVCKEPVNNPGWSQSYTYTYGCRSDIGTGCGTPNITETETREMEYKKVNWTIKDNIGNTTACSTNLKVNVDTTPPTCEIKVISGGTGTNQNCILEPTTKEVCLGFWIFKSCHDETVYEKTCYEEPTGWYNTNVQLKMFTNDNLSGVSEYGISTSTTPIYNNLDEVTVTDDTNSNGRTYYGYVKDKAGNTNTCQINIKKDSVAPSCSWSGENTTWTTNKQTIKATCQDYASGCSTTTPGTSWSYSSGTVRTSQLSYEVRDKAGNSTTCSKNASVYLDKEGPSLPEIVNADSFFGINPIEIKCNDAGDDCNIVFKRSWVSFIPPYPYLDTASPIVYSANWYSYDAGSGVYKYELYAWGLGEKSGVCYAGQECKFSTFEKPNFKVTAVDNLGNRSKTLTYHFKCKLYGTLQPFLVPIEIGEVSCFK